MRVGIHGFPFKIKENFALFACVFRMKFFFSLSVQYVMVTLKRSATAECDIASKEG